ncbi:MAG: DNA/RNA nuclease SfsA [Desulfurococcaceae archaeon TW002]
MVVRLFKLNNLIRCELIERLNRFTVKIMVGSEADLAHLTNTGRLREYIVRGREGLCSIIGGSKLKYRLVAVKDVEGYAILDTLTQSKIFEYLLEHRLIPWLAECTLRSRNFRLVGVVIDYVLECVDGVRLAELKSAVLRVDSNYASYPDCPTIRGRKQIKVLADYSSVFKPYVILIASLPNVTSFKPYCLGDPEIINVIKYASEKGVTFKAINTYLDIEKWVILASTDLQVKLEC